jgi:hypothetical protein
VRGFRSSSVDRITHGFSSVPRRVGQSFKLDAELSRSVLVILVLDGDLARQFIFINGLSELINEEKWNKE